MRRFLFAILMLLFVSCSNSTGYKKRLDVYCYDREPQELVIRQYDKALFEIDTMNFAEGVSGLHDDFPELIPARLNEEQINYLKLFVTDTFCLRINDLVRQTFPDVTKIESDVKSVYQHLNYYYPDIPILPTYTYISGIDENSGPIMVTPDYVMISLDYYLSNKNLIYDYVGMPRFMSLRCRPENIVRDLAQELYFKYLRRNIITRDVLSEMIERGKMYYFIEALMPSAPDSLLLGYSASQMKWAENNEGHVWASVVGNKMLYDNDLEVKRMLFNEGPFTAAYSTDAPARLGDFLGLHIVRSFMSSNDVSLTNLLNISDEQEIFQMSQYKPSKR